jgi:glycosyltransferase involved in cell wall biosynthesis
MWAMERPYNKESMMLAEGTSTLQLPRTRLQSEPQTEVQKPQFEALSVLMPVYNEEATIAEIVRRVLDVQLPSACELIIVDDASTDGTWQIVEQLAENDFRIKAIRHETNRGKGAAVRTAIDQMTGDVAVVQDADLEYDPSDYPTLLGPILAGKADAVFGSRFSGHSRRVMLFWHSVVNWVLTLLSNLVNNLNLTDMETCYKMVRADVLKQLTLKGDSFTFEPELTCRLAQWGARIYEVPIGYAGRTFEEGKKIRPIDGLKALWEIVRCRFFDTQFTKHSGFYILTAVARAKKYNRWTLKQVERFLGRRILEAGAGIGNLSTLLMNRERLVMVDNDEMYIERLKQRFGRRKNVQIQWGNLCDPQSFDRWKAEQLDTVVCMNVLEHLEHDWEVLSGFEQTLMPGGHCVIVVPAGRWLYNGTDEELGHFRRYTIDELKQKMKFAGLEVVFAKQFNRLGSLGWFFSGRVMRRRHLSPRQMIWFDRLLPIAKLLDYVLPVPGMSLIMVGRKSDTDAMARAA